MVASARLLVLISHLSGQCGSYEGGISVEAGGTFAVYGIVQVQYCTRLHVSSWSQRFAREGRALLAYKQMGGRGKERLPRLAVASTACKCKLQPFSDPTLVQSELEKPKPKPVEIGFGGGVRFLA